MTANPLRVLVVDDSVGFRTTLRLALVYYGYETIDVGSAGAALEILAHQSFDAIITDLELPDMSGVLFIERCHQWPRCPPIILISGHPMGYINAVAGTLPIAAVVAKPFELSAFDRILSRCITGHVPADPS